MMKRLQKENVKKCFFLLREFIEETPSVSNKKGLAVLALKQLQNITAGTGFGETGSTVTDPDPGCHEVPRIDGNPSGIG
jgi:hypothetical protein